MRFNIISVALCFFCVLVLKMRGKEREIVLLYRKSELSEGGFYVRFMDIRQYHHRNRLNPDNALRRA